MLKNPSTHGGTWAYCLAGGEADTEVYGLASGVVTPAMIGLPTVTNNFTELYAAVMGLTALPNAWSGKIYTDSRVTQLRLIGALPKQAPVKMNGIPDWLEKLLKAQVDYRGLSYQVVLLDGHPTRKHLSEGVSEVGLPVHANNVLCDKLCGEQSARWLKGRNLEEVTIEGPSVIITDSMIDNLLNHPVNLPDAALEDDHV